MKPLAAPQLGSIPGKQERELETKHPCRFGGASLLWPMTVCIYLPCRASFEFSFASRSLMVATSVTGILRHVPAGYHSAQWQAVPYPLRYFRLFLFYYWAKSKGGAVSFSQHTCYSVSGVPDTRVLLQAPTITTADRSSGFDKLGLRLGRRQRNSAAITEPLVNLRCHRHVFGEPSLAPHENSP